MNPCHAKVKNQYLGNEMPCRNGAKIKRGEGWYCWQHDPEGKAKREAATKKRIQNTEDYNNYGKSKTS